MQLRTFAKVTHLEDVRHHARSMDPDRHGFLVVPIAHHQRQVVNLIGGLTKADGFESTKGCVEIDFCRSFNQAFVLQAMRDEVCNGDEFHVVTLGKNPKLWKASHGAILVHDFNNDSCGFKPCKAREINGSFGVAGATEDPTGFRTKGENVPGTTQLLGLGVWVNQCLNCLRPVACGNARGASVPQQIHGHGEGCFVSGIVGLHHQSKVKFVTARLQQWCANEPSSVGGHEVDDFRGGMPRGNEEVPFVLAIFIVHDNDDFSSLDGFDGFRNGVQGWHGRKGREVGGCSGLTHYLRHMIRPIVAYGDPVLKKEAVEVEEGRADLAELISDMWETMYAADGVGLAAPQIGLSLRLFVADGSPFGEGENGDPGCQGFKRVMINPVLFDFSEDEDVMDEGCLSIPGVREPVTRPIKLGVEYYDEHWNLVEETLGGLAARIVQHENDHLDGVMIPDHIPATKRLLLHGKLRDIGLGKVPVDYKMRFPKTKRR